MRPAAAQARRILHRGRVLYKELSKVSVSIHLTWYPYPLRFVVRLVQVADTAPRLRHSALETCAVLRVRIIRSLNSSGKCTTQYKLEAVGSRTCLTAVPV